ncbi:PqiC family protein [Roseovarius sp. SCSIO 43702]|uniref:PqiC family protein n=1 Tax=Roseovarius sp. SCSIO 43702 TaxID=2823043 RepID=UPI001C736209|nr:PqiC family protein [Roseovarius sp. SCSIO 43702]QYX57217.1 PqiC family protein [Roseovarius sp. SCSIO 43702]
MFIKRSFFLLALATGLAACGGDADRRVTVPPAPAGAVQGIAHRSVSIREVSLPTYAASEDIYARDAEGTLSVQKGLLWADAPGRAMTLELARYLTQVTRARIAAEPWPFEEYPDAVVEVRVEDMYADATGLFRLSGQYYVSAGLNASRSHLFSVSVPIAGERTALDIAAARGQAVRNLARQIAAKGLR